MEDKEKIKVLSRVLWSVTHEFIPTKPYDMTTLKAIVDGEI